MKGLRVVLGTLILLLLAIASRMTSQEKNAPPQTSYAYEKANQQTVRGWVVAEKDFQCPVSGTMGSHITVKNETGSIEVHLAPAQFMKQYEINIPKDANVTVIGSRIMFDGKPALIAKSVAIGRDTYSFRDDKGKPLW